MEYSCNCEITNYRKHNNTMSTKYLFAALTASTGHPIRKLILIYLADSANDSGEAYRAHSRIAKECECSVATIKRHLDWLLVEGYVEWDNRSNKGFKVVNKYSLLEPEHIRTNGKLKIAHSELTDSSERAIVPITIPIKTNTTTRPTVEEVGEYVKTRQIKINPEAFIDYYSANGWKVGRNSMKDWRAAVRTWEKNEKQRPKPTGKSTKHTTLQEDLTDTSWA